MAVVRVFFTEWSGIKAGLEAFFNQRKALRLKMEERDLLISRLQQLTHAVTQYRRQTPQDQLTAFPRPLDLTDLRMTFHFATLPLNATLPEAWIANLLPDLIRQWQEKRAQDVLSLLGVAAAPGSAFPGERAVRITRSTSNSRPPPFEPTALLFCTKCRQVVTAYQAMTHSCCYGIEFTWRAWTPSYPEIDGKLPIFEGDLFANACLVHSRGYLPWNHECLLPCHTVASDILRACGKEPMNPSLGGDLLGSSAPRVACGRCSSSQKYLLVMGWRAAVSAYLESWEVDFIDRVVLQVLHAFDEHGGAPVSWMPVAPQVVSKVCAVEKLRCHQAAQEETRQAGWSCLICAYPASEIVYQKYSLEVHLFLRYGFELYIGSVQVPDGSWIVPRHRITTRPILGADHAKSPQSPDYMQPPILVISTSHKAVPPNTLHRDGEMLTRCQRVGYVSPSALSFSWAS